MERQTNSYRMRAHVEQCSGITVKSRETPDTILYTSLWSKGEHNELKSTSSPGAQSVFGMTENESYGNAGKKQRNSVILVSHMLAVHHSLRII